jgi:hypothetical protein
VVDHPIRLGTSDDLRRSRPTVFFRLLLAMPHLVWLALWTVAATGAALVGWVAALIEGRLPAAIHGFLARYVRYLLHVSAYVLLAASPYPPFSGPPGEYPVDLEIDPPERQRRWAVAFRLVLAIPAVALAAALIGARGAGYTTRTGNYELAFAGLGTTVAVLGWFACLVQARMPRGFRDALLYALRYTAQAQAYVLLVTGRYPEADPWPALAEEAPAHPVCVAADDELRRSRLTTFFRLLLALPHLVWLLLWTIAVVFSAVACWLLALVRGAPPRALHRFHSAYVRYTVHLSSFLYLVANPFPGFAGAAGSYPVDAVLPEAEPQRRLVTAFRAILVVPAWIVGAALGDVAFVVGVLGWFASLVLGRMPRGLRNAGLYAIRYSAQLTAYGLFVTERYPFSGPWQATPETESEPEPEPGWAY